MFANKYITMTTPSPKNIERGNTLKKINRNIYIYYYVAITVNSR